MPIRLRHTNKRTGVVTEKDYWTVAERLTLAGDKLLSVRTHISQENEQAITVWAEIVTDKGTFMGHARSNKDADFIEGESPLEVAETSAVGRALAFAGYGSADSIASVEEVQGKAEPNVKMEMPNQAEEPQCPTHHKSKFGRGGFYCPTKVGGGWCTWRFKGEEATVYADEVPWDDGAPVEEYPGQATAADMR